MSGKAQIEARLANPAPMAVGALADLALDALDYGLFEQIKGRIERDIENGVANAKLYQILGIARRELLDSAGAATAFERAAALAPADVKIMHGLARSTMEAGFPAAAHYEQALRFAPRNAELLLGRAAALVAEARGGEAKASMEQALAANPGWYAGHLAYSRIVDSVSGDGNRTSTVRTALLRYPHDPSLWRVLLRLLIDARCHNDAVEVARAATARLGSSPDWQRAEAVALSESGDAAGAQALFDCLPPGTTVIELIERLRNLIRLGRFEQAVSLAEHECPMPDSTALWPYRALLWRLSGDERWYWLEGDSRLIGVYDLDLSTSEINRLAGVLRSLHDRSGTFIDQTVRGGTQTDGNLFARAEPEIQHLRAVLLDAIRSHVDQLPAPVVGHPTLIEHRTPVRFTGSWSVRLSGAGFHVDHVHPQGWLSSAFYVVLPNNEEAQNGCLVFGEVRDLLPTLHGFRLVKPVAGRLVLFPSTMWHGTRPFTAGERLTVAFDVARS